MTIRFLNSTIVAVSIFISSAALSEASEPTIDNATRNRMLSGLTYTCVLIGQERWQDAIDVANSIKIRDGEENKKASLSLYALFKKALDETGDKRLTTENCYSYTASFLGIK